MMSYIQKCRKWLKIGNSRFFKNVSIDWKCITIAFIRTYHMYKINIQHLGCNIFSRWSRGHNFKKIDLQAIFKLPFYYIMMYNFVKGLSLNMYPISKSSAFNPKKKSPTSIWPQCHLKVTRRSFVSVV